MNGNEREIVIDIYEMPKTIGIDRGRIRQLSDTDLEKVRSWIERKIVYPDRRRFSVLLYPMPIDMALFIMGFLVHMPQVKMIKYGRPNQIARVMYCAIDGYPEVTA